MPGEGPAWLLQALSKRLVLGGVGLVARELGSLPPRHALPRSLNDVEILPLPLWVLLPHLYNESSGPSLSKEHSHPRTLS